MTEEIDDEVWRVRLDAFEGPMDLLLFLIQKNEVDVHDIPVATILEQYLVHLRELEELDLDRAGDFLVLASTLMAVKAAMLLPGETLDEGGAIDPREDLVRQIIAYREVKEAGEQLKTLHDAAGRRWPRGRSPVPELPEDQQPEPPGVREATLYDVFAAFQRLLRETQNQQVRKIVYDDVPMERHIERIEGLLAAHPEGISLEHLLGERRDRRFVLGTFLAVLELMKERKVIAAQDGASGEIRVVEQESEAGQGMLAAIAARARRIEAEPVRAPKRPGPPWKKKGAAEPEADAAAQPDADATPTPAPGDTAAPEDTAGDAAVTGIDGAA